MAPDIDLILHELSHKFGEEFHPIGDPVYGQSNLILVISSSSGLKFSVRISYDEFAARLARQGQVLDFLEGEPVGIWNHNRLSDDTRKRYIDDLSHFYLTLWTVCPPPLRSSKVDHAFLRALHSTDGSWGDPMSFLLRRSFINVIDWDYARVVPAGSAVHHPLFIADIPGWVNDGVDQGESFHDDRAYLENAIAVHGRQSPHADALRRLLETSHERQFFELSLRNKRINKEYVKKARLSRIESENSRSP
ncbi:hypothetical protein KVT40_003801 [Elsinoe batatas]|uniref:Uncharacterized protein n=1 Tax=Elsinoe batatas TaxID=2601811 RepID=A0A8K0PHY6_9PEZI|nr:hypothetical protein KVT40_003801 [Elsinoe batatas]